MHHVQKRCTQRAEAFDVAAMHAFGCRTVECSAREVLGGHADTSTPYTAAMS